MEFTRRSPASAYDWYTTILATPRISRCKHAESRRTQLIDLRRASLYLYTLAKRAIAQEFVAQPGKSYLSFKPNMLLPAGGSGNVSRQFPIPFGNSYGYSTAKQQC